MFLKEYRYILDDEEFTLYAVVTYGGEKINANIVNVFVSQSYVDNAKQYNHIDCGYEKVEQLNGGYYINSEYKDGKGTGDYLDEFMEHYVACMSAKSIKKVTCVKCGKDEFDVMSHMDKIWCKSCMDISHAKHIVLR